MHQAHCPRAVKLWEGVKSELVGKTQLTLTPLPKAIPRDLCLRVLACLSRRAAGEGPRPRRERDLPGLRPVLHYLEPRRPQAR